MTAASRQPLVVGNWKMNGSRASNRHLVEHIRERAGELTDVELAVCPPAVYLDEVAAMLTGGNVELGAQIVSDQATPGAYTGEIHAAMIHELGCKYVIVGHSERRALYGESDQVAAQKFRVAQAFDLIPIFCVGETLQERQAEATESILEQQLQAVIDLCGYGAFARAVIAYEPVWAIGTGHTATPAQAQAVHAFLRARLAPAGGTIAQSIRLLYGGSVKPDNAAELFACADVDGGLIGGASLKSKDFLAIAAAAHR